MADPQDEDFDKRYAECKSTVKRWEKLFKAQNGRIPSKYDIKEASSEVRRAYSRYFHTKARLLEGVLGETSNSPPPVSPPSPLPESAPSPVGGGPSSLPTVDQIERLVNSRPEKVWGEHLNKRRATLAQRRVESSRNFIEHVSPKLYESWKFNKRNPRKSVRLKRNENCDSFEDLSQNSDVCYSFATEPDISLTIGRTESQSSSLSVIDVQRPNSTRINSVRALSSRSATVHDIDSNWVKRCNIELSSSKEHDIENCTVQNDDDAHERDRISDRIKTYGLSNLRMNCSVFCESDDGTPDCIENSESESERSFSRKNYQRLRPIVKKKKMDSSKTIAVGLESSKSSDIDNSTSETISEDRKQSIVNNNPKKKTRKTASKSVKKSKASHKKKSKVKAELKTVDKDEETENEVDLLGDSNIEMPRFILKSSILKENNIVDGLLNALELPKKKKVKEREQFNDSETYQEERLREKLNSGTINDNFVRINIEKKVFVRGKKSVNYSKFKKQQWKNKKKKMLNSDMEFPEGGLLKCFKCNEIGHLSRYCRAHKGNHLLPLKDVDEVSHKTLQEAENPNSQKVENSSKEHFSFQNVIQNSQEKDAFTDVGGSDKKIEYVPDSFLRLCEKSIDDVFVPHTVSSLYQLNANGTLIVTPQEVRDALQLFGYSDFRDGQECAVMRILSGLSTLVTLSTGSGKSLCYQLPAYLYSKYNKCITVVISPLVSLMEDQVINMPRFLRAACLHTNQTPTQRQKIIELIKNNEIDVLLISPEAVVSSERSSGFSGILRHLPPIAFVCIDEVHCVSQWSHNFRPSYLMICRVLKENMHVRCLLGLTATATVTTTKSIMHHLGISDGLNGVISNIPIPKNLVLTVSRDSNKDRAVMELLLSERFKNFDSIIVYCIRRDECERVAALIRTSLPDVADNSFRTEKSNRKRKRSSWHVDTYHAGMSATKRHRVQEAFMNNNLKIVVATVAFGMGINKADIRGVIHYNMPSSFESYVQEVGRAGRDGLIAHCHTFIGDHNKDKNELLRHIHANTIERYIIRKLLQKIFIPCSCKTIKGKNMETTEIQNANICNGHEVAFSIEETVRELDIPTENISTLLCYLELTFDKYMKVLSNVYTMCKIISYGGSMALLDMAEKSPPLAMAIALEKSKGKSFDNVGTFEFCVIDVAAALGWKSGLVKHHLKNLEWDKNNDKIKKSPLRVEFHTLGFRVLAPGDFTASQLDSALDSLFERTQLQEKTKLNQLNWVSKSLLDVSHVSVSKCSCFETESVASDNSEKLKSNIQNYFSHESLPIITTNEEIRSNDSQLIADIRGLIATYHDCTFTAKAIARILQGISSPNFPAIVWGRCKYWRRHIAVNFYKILEIAKQQILLLK